MLVGVLARSLPGIVYAYVKWFVSYIVNAAPSPIFLW